MLGRIKPVIAVKSGRHAQVTPGLADNSAPLSDAAVATLFDHSGVIRTPGLTAAFDVAHLLSTQPVPSGVNSRALWLSLLTLNGSLFERKYSAESATDALSQVRVAW